jgi:ribonuclease P protein component
VIVGKHGHTVVERNLLRRRLRELVRTRLIPVVGGKDIVVRVLATGYDASFDQLSGEISEVIAGLSREQTRL